MNALPSEIEVLETRQMTRTSPLMLDEPNCVWQVASGVLDIFVAQLTGEGEGGSRHHLVRVEAGQLLFPFPKGGAQGDVLFLATGAGTGLRKISLTSLETAAKVQESGFGEQIEGWVSRVAERISTGSFPGHQQIVAVGSTVHAAPGDMVRAEEFAWLRQDSGRSMFASVPHLELGPGTITPVATGSWVESIEAGEISALSTHDVVQSGGLGHALGTFQETVAAWARSWLSQLATEEGARLRTKAAAERQAVVGAVGHLSALLDTGPMGNIEHPHADPLVGAYILIGEVLRVPIKIPPGLFQPRRFRNPLLAIAKASRLRVRRVVLMGEWWKQDSGPILGYRAQGSQPVALLPSSPTSYILIDPLDRRRVNVTAEVAETLASLAFTFSRPFPETAITVGTLLKFGLHNTRKDIVTMLVLGVAGGALGLLLPLLTGLLFDEIIPSAARNELFYAAGALLIAGFARVVFDMIRALALLRLESKSDASVQGAVWDRLLSLPLPFFRNFTAGDLSDRANGINAIRAIASGAVLNAVLSGVFSLFSFALLFYYSIPLALLATGLIAFYVAFSVVVSLYGLRFQRPIYDLQGKISGQVLQFITGITKLRVAGAELHAYAVWARGFARQKTLHLSISRIFTRFNAFGDVYPIITTLCLFVGIVWAVGGRVSTGTFLAFSAAFSTFLYAMLELSGALISLLHAIPIYDRAKPILRALPEVNETKADPGELRGKIELSRVSFRYKADGPWVLRDISVQILPGRFIAIVGPSGAGKSTFIRLLLGFDPPESGTITYDGMELSGLDIQSVRKQIGVVLQNGKLMPGDIYQNIVGSSQLSLETAWQAAETAGLDEDIRQMPMGMHTVLSEGAGTLSGGQRQRLMIARAVVARPRILIFDEATSALDNRTQAIISRSLERLQATRIVIAHRLSTVINADKIIVIQGGQIVQSGSYNELVEQEGPFAELASRQLA